MTTIYTKFFDDTLRLVEVNSDYSVFYLIEYYGDLLAVPLGRVVEYKSKWYWDLDLSACDTPQNAACRLLDDFKHWLNSLREQDYHDFLSQYVE